MCLLLSAAFVLPATHVAADPSPAETESWQYLDRGSGQSTGSENRDEFRSTTESMIKPWIVADYLRRVDQPSPARLDELSRVIRDSDDNATEDIYRLGGTDAVVRRMISTCGLTHTGIEPYWWSLTTMTVTDAAKLGLCLADGRAAGRWTDWLLGEMKQVRGGVDDQHGSTGGGRWGIIDGLPLSVVSDTAIKNGWTEHGSQWRVNCLAIHPEFVLAVMLSYPVDRGLAYGASQCAEIARQEVRRSSGSVRCPHHPLREVVTTEEIKQ